MTLQSTMPAAGAEGVESDARLRQLVDSIGGFAVCVLDPEGRVTSWSEGARRATGHRAAEILGKHFSCFYTEEDRLAGLPERTLRGAVEHDRIEAEGWRLRKDGVRYWAHILLDAIRDEHGALAGFVRITRDIGESQRAEALRKSEQQFRILVQSVTDYAIFMLDPMGRVSSWNAGAERIKGYAPEEIIGEHFSRFYTEEDRAAGMPARSLEEARRTGRFEKEGWRVRKDGTRFVAHVVIDAIRDPNGELIGFAKVTRDITERRLAQQSLEQAQQALFQTQKLESLGQLTGGVAHDFNNLLTAIIGSLDLLRKRLPDDPRSLALLDNALHGAARGATLTQRMLAFARRQDLKIAAIDVAALVGGMMGLLERSIGPGVVIETRFPVMLPPVRTDANQLETALLNLALNARDAMSDGGVITLSAREERIDETAALRRDLKAGRYVCVSVTDTGQGMDAATLAHATEPFFTTKGVGKGTGLGLSMVQGIAEQSGGKLSIESRVGVGTTVNILLPTTHARIEQPRPPPPALPVPVDAHRRVILLVDDDELVLRSTSALLEDLGYHVIEATSAEHALERLCSGQPIDLMITDHAMPGMTGLQLARETRVLRPELPVILATGYAELPHDSAEGLRRLSKPYSVPELAHAVASALLSVKA